MSTLRNSLVMVSVLAGSLAWSAEPTPEEKLPAPRVVPDLILPNPMYYRQSHYDVWQMYAPDQVGYFRPRVIYSPSGAYWAYNGAPYPYTVTSPGSFMPTAVGTPYRAAPAFMPYCED